MGFLLARSETFKTKVHVVYTDEDGTLAKDSFKAEFKRPSKQALESMLKAEESEQSDDEFFDEYFVGFTGLKGPKGDVEYNDSNRAALLSMPEVAKALTTAFIEAVYPNIRTKN